MKLFLKSLLPVLLFLSSQFSLVFPGVTIMPQNEVKPGMKAVCKTVFQGTQVEDFELEIIDIIENFSPKSNVFLVRLTSPKAIETGVVSGMSGSPVYIDGKLIGALAYRFGDFTKEAIGGVTPIEQMLAMFEKEKVRSQERAMSSSGNEFPTDLLFSPARTQTEQEAIFVNYIRQQFPSPVSNSGLVPIRVPISVSGLNSDLKSRFAATFERLGFLLVQSGGIQSSGAQSIPLEAGCAISGVILEGDLNISGTGTLTFIDGNQILAFGHPLLSSGPANLPFAPAKILTTISSMYSSYKMAQTGNIVGTLHQDRTSGVMGIIGEVPPMIPIHLKYISPFGDENNYNFRMANDKSLNSLTPYFMFAALYNAVYSARMGDGDYNTTLSGQIQIANSDDIVLDNYFAGSASSEDAAASTSEVAILAAALLNNKFLIPEIEKIDVTLKSSLGNKSAEIERIWYDKSQVKAGETIDLNIFIRPFQHEPVKLSEKIFIPQNVTPGIYTIIIGSANFVSRLESSLAPGKFLPYNFSHLVKLLNQRRKNNTLTIQMRKPENGTIIDDKEFTGLPPSVLQIMNSKKTGSKAGKLRDVLLIEQKKQVDWALDGGQIIRIIVKNEKL